MVVCAGPLGHGGTHTADCAFVQRLGFVSLSWALVSGNAAGRQLQTRTRLLVEASGCVRAPCMKLKKNSPLSCRGGAATTTRAGAARKRALHEQKWAGSLRESQLAATKHSVGARLANANATACNAETRDRTGDLQIFGLTLSQLSYRGCCAEKGHRRRARPQPTLHQSRSLGALAASRGQAAKAFCLASAPLARH